MDRNRFTLIELLVVIAIIAILASLLLPALNEAKVLATRAECMSRQKQLGVAAYSYASESDGYIPVGHTGTDYGPLWAPSLLHYTGGNAQVFNCPKSYWQWDGGSFGNRGSMGVMYQDPYNYLQPHPDPTKGMKPANNVWWPAWPLSEGTGWKDPNDSMYLADAFISFDPISYPSVEPKTCGTTHLHGTDRGNYFTGGGGARRFADRHRGTNVLFLDGRVVSYHTATLDRTQRGLPGTVWDVQ